MMAVHKRCTEQARNATGQTCGLNDDFRELNSIMDKRLIEFADCVSSVDTFEVEDDEEIPEAACRQISFQPIVEQITCWRTVASVRAKCLQLQRCCPSAKSCKKQGQHSEYTQALRAKHIEINRRTLECREQMQQLVDMKQESPKAHGAVSSTYEKPIDVSNSY
uniref:Uncharacterized protein n=1 Tax=Acrobeloides nanus TaxID=290746 RepID=A0A914ERK8_9BILA